MTNKDKIVAFLSGQTFNLSDTLYKFSPNGGGESTGCIVNVIKFDDGRELMMNHQANVKSISDKVLKAYTFRLGQQHKYTIRWNDIEFV